jgi:hypothetical protein
MKSNNARVITLWNSLVPVVGLMAFGAMWLLGSETVTLLDKRLPSGDRVRVVWERRPSEDVADWERQQSALRIIAPTHLYVILHTRQCPDGQTIWTNRHFLFDEPVGEGFSTHTAYDVCQIGTNLWLCYKHWATLFCEQVWGRPAGSPRERLELERDNSLFLNWTNAVFSVDTNGVPILTAFRELGSKAVWRYQDQEWKLDLEASEWKPSPMGLTAEQEAGMAYRGWCKFRLEGGLGWTVVKTNPAPMPKLKP